MKPLSRREFLKVSALGVGGMVLGGGTLAGCAAPAAVGPAVGAVGGGAAGAAVSAAGPTVAGYLIQFASAIGSAVVADRFIDWLDRLSEEARARVAPSLDRMHADAFIHFDTPVFNYGGIEFLGALNSNGYNACSLHVANDPLPLLRGPELMAISCCGIYWANQGYGYGDLLLPLCAYQDAATRFDTSFSGYRYATLAGTLELSYNAYPSSNTGEVYVLARSSNGQTYVDESYLLAYS